MRSMVTPMDKFSPLNADDICRIIEASAKAGVFELSVDDLHLKFGPNPAPRAQIHEPATPSESPSLPRTAIPEPDHEKLTEESIEREAEIRKQLVYDELLITNPYEAEMMRARGEITDAEQSDGNGIEG